MPQQSRMAGILLLVAAAANLVAVVLFNLRGGVSGGSPPSDVYLVIERGLLMAAMLVSAAAFLLVADHAAVALRLGALGYAAAGVVGVVGEGLVIGDANGQPVIATYVVLAFVTQALVGAALASARLIPRWIGWLTVAWNLGWLLILPVISPDDIYYPILNLLMAIPLGIALIRAAGKPGQDSAEL